MVKEQAGYGLMIWHVQVVSRISPTVVIAADGEVTTVLTAKTPVWGAPHRYLDQIQYLDIKSEKKEKPLNIRWWSVY